MYHCPYEINKLIVEYLSIKDMINLSMTNKYYYNFRKDIEEKMFRISFPIDFKRYHFILQNNPYTQHPILITIPNYKDQYILCELIQKYTTNNLQHLLKKLQKNFIYNRNTQRILIILILTVVFQNHNVRFENNKMSIYLMFNGCEFTRFSRYYKHSHGRYLDIKQLDVSDDIINETTEEFYLRCINTFRKTSIENWDFFGDCIRTIDVNLQEFDFLCKFDVNTHVISVYNGKMEDEDLAIYSIIQMNRDNSLYQEHYNQILNILLDNGYNIYFNPRFLIYINDNRFHRFIYKETYNRIIQLIKN